jgi:hypothetical protein
MRKPLEERFWEKVHKGGPKDCWLWTGSTTGDNLSVTYGIFWQSHSTRLVAHKQAYILTHGEVPTGLQVCHTCDNGLCCNPAHMFVGTLADNMQDMRAKGRGKNEAWKITKEIAAEILRLRYDEHWTLKRLGDKFGLTVNYLTSMCRGKKRPDVYAEFMAARLAQAA